MHKHLEKICDIKNTLIDKVECELAKDCVDDPQELGMVVDMIKDLAVAEEKCVKAAYYDAMTGEDGEPEESRMGYNPRRYASGRYAPSGAGRLGYTDYHIRRMEGSDNERMGNMGGRYGYVEGPNTYMGYYPSGEGNRSQSGSRMGYEDGVRDTRYGYSYNEYRNARRNYTQTHSEEDRKKMREHANEHMADTIATVRDIWENADQEQKMRLRQDLQNLINEMNV